MTDEERREQVRKNRAAMLKKRGGGRSPEEKSAAADSARSTVTGALFFIIPGGAIIRVASGAAKAIKTFRAMRGVKQIKNPTAAQIKKAKPPSALSQRPKPKTAVVLAGGRQVKSPGRQITRTDRVIDGDKASPRPMRNVTPPKTGTRSLTSNRVPANRVASTTKTVTALSSKQKVPDTKPNFPTEANAAVPKTMPKPRPKKPTKDKPTKRVNLGTVTARKVASTPDSKKIDPKGRPKGRPKTLDAGGNTGFGLKGNTFVGGPEERAVMMKYYGGTGSAAAKAAQQGSQGRLKELGKESLTKELKAARAKRFAREKANSKNRGGVIKKVVSNRRGMR